METIGISFAIFFANNHCEIKKSVFIFQQKRGIVAFSFSNIGSPQKQTLASFYFFTKELFEKTSYSWTFLVVTTLAPVPKIFSITISPALASAGTRA